VAGLPAGLLSQERILVSTQGFFALWRAVGEVSGDPAIGLLLGKDLPLEGYDPAAIAALCSRTYRDALQRIARYKKLSCPEEIRLGPGSSVHEFVVEFAFLLGHHGEPGVLVDVCLAWILSVGQRGTGHWMVPLRLEVNRSHGPALADHFGCEVMFGQQRNALVLRTSDVDRPFVTHNEHLLSLLAPQLEEELSTRESLEQQERGVLRRRLAGHCPRLPEVADELGLTPRTLQRRLTELGLSFQRVLETSRHELARLYLGESRLELSETAYLLGYDDANSFFRAFQRWEGTTPGQWRSRRQNPALAL
jgi:AraC-like DNA-binding protein